MNGYKIVLLKAIFMLYKLLESERVCSGICNYTYHSFLTVDKKASALTVYFYVQ